MSAPTHDGGKPMVKSIPYSPPQGPTSQTHKGPGLGGDNHGNCGSQGGGYPSSRESGRVGIGGDKHRNGSQR